MVEVSTFQSVNGHDLLLHIFSLPNNVFLHHGVEVAYTSPAYMLNVEHLYVFLCSVIYSHHKKKKNKEIS